MKPWILGLTGGIGSGKTATAECFERQGVHVVDADQAARWVVMPGEPALERIVEHFGSDVLLASGALNRAALRQRIFQDAAARHWLESLLHPLIRPAIEPHLAQAHSPYAILVSPLLIESGQHQRTQRVLVVDVPEALQVQRAMNRDAVDEAQVQAILKAQMQREDRLRYAHEVLVNDQTPAWLEREVQRLHQFYLTLKGGASA